MSTPAVPGFEFLQNLMKGAAMPGMGPWITPTVDPDELQKRIAELKTVQFWLDSNTKLLGATIQALEVQRMTLVTLRSMNLPLPDLQGALKAGSPPAAAAAAGAAAAVDPLQWWGALTQQFTEIASQAMKPGEPPPAAAGQAQAEPESARADGISTRRKR